MHTTLKWKPRQHLQLRGARLRVYDQDTYTGSFAAERPRLVILTDIGGDPDDQQSMVRLMMYVNEFDLELLLASAAGTPGELKQAVTRPDLIREIVDAYGQVLPNLARHAANWPSAEAPSSAPSTTPRARAHSSLASTPARSSDRSTSRSGAARRIWRRPFGA